MYLSLIHCIQRTIRRAVIAAAAITALATAHAQVPDRDWPSVVVSPILDVPMHDTAITRGPDGVYYLTGTLGTPDGSRPRHAMDGHPVTGVAPAPGPRNLPPNGQGYDFDNCQAIKIWRSDDLKNWRELCVAWDLREDVLGPKGDISHLQTRWMRKPRLLFPAGENGKLAHGIQAPELHHIKGGWYICFSLNGQGTFLLKSSSGKPEGPYEAHATITLRGHDPSMFWDVKDEFGGDGKVYWLFGGGWIAEMNDDLTAISGRPRLIQPEPESPADWMRAKGAQVFQDFPQQVGERGAFVFKTRGRYYLCAADYYNRVGERCDDTFVVSADNLRGPWSGRHLMVPHGGQATVFPGPRSSAVPKYHYPQQDFYLNSVSQYAQPKNKVDLGKADPTFYATFSGTDARAIFRDRPSFLPLEWAGPGRTEPSLFADLKSFPRKPQSVFTERGPWPWMKPLLENELLRDMHVSFVPNPDKGTKGGKYYFSGSIISHPGQMHVWESEDLADWRRVGPLWTYEQIEWLPKKLPFPKNRYPENPKGDLAWQHIFWHGGVVPWKGDLYIRYCIFNKEDDATMRGTAFLKSTTGKIEGPYISLGRYGGQIGHDLGPSLYGFFEYQRKPYSFDVINWKPVVAEADFNLPGEKWPWKRVDGGIYQQYANKDGFGVDSVAGKIIFSNSGSGRVDNREQTDNTTYCVNYLVAETPWGPPRGVMRTLPHCSAANRFQDHNGYYWSVFFGDDHFAPWWCQFGLVPLRIEDRGPYDLVMDVEDHPDDYQKRIMGGGQIAEVKTVQETLK